MRQGGPQDLSVRCDPTNPGQVFAACGLFELAHRICPATHAMFRDGRFYLQGFGSGTLGDLLVSITQAQLKQNDPENETASPISLPPPFNLVLDWWCRADGSGNALKVWAGSMRNWRIARAMQGAMASAVHDENLFEHGVVVFDADEPKKKVEPFYFDARRGGAASALDVGFSPDSLPDMKSIAYPAVEFLCLVGLQRFQPAPTIQRRIFTYRTWNIPLPIGLAAAGFGEVLPAVPGERFQFESGFRTDQRKHKAFLPATRVWRA